jgi:cell division protein FtsB
MRRWLGTLVLTLLLVAIQAQVWFGRGSVAQINQLQQELQDQRARNDQAELRNQQLAAEVGDLKTGLDMVEEKARMELGMVKDNEIYVHIGRKGLK